MGANFGIAGMDRQQLDQLEPAALKVKGGPRAMSVLCQLSIAAQKLT
jgi:hypothetical protein